MAIEVIHPGLLTTVQDMGRVGHAADGYPECGACDKEGFILTNILVGNHGDEAVLECTCLGPVLRFTEIAVVAVCGGTPAVDGIPVPCGYPYLVCAGSTLSIGQTKGMRAYIAVHGGIAVEPVLGSRSTDLFTHIGGCQGRACKAGDVLPTAVYNAPAVYRSLRQRIQEPMLPPAAAEIAAIHVIPGPQDDLFTAEETQTFYGSIYKVSVDSNRMGVRLTGNPVTAGRSTDILSDAILEGSIQISANGLPIIMLADHQTTGGYAKIATVVPTDIPLLAQLQPGSQLRFEKIDPELALARYRKKNEEWQSLRERMEMKTDESRPELGSGRKLRRLHHRERRGRDKVRHICQRGLRLSRR